MTIRLAVKKDTLADATETRSTRWLVELEEEIGGKGHACPAWKACSMTCWQWRTAVEDLVI